MCNYAYQKTGNTADAEDVVQNIFVRLLSGNNRDYKEEEIKHYLFKSVKNGIIDLQRKNAKMARNVDLDGQLVDIDEPNDEEIENMILKDRIMQSIRHLPPKCQDIFVRSKIDGYTYQEIANEMEISIKTVEAQMTKAFKILREELNNLL